MNRRMATLGVAAVGVIAGAVGIGLLAAPAGAGQAPNLPATTPDALVASVLSAHVPAMAGTVEIDNNLGLPTIPGVPQAGNGKSEIRVWTDGATKARVSIPTMSNEQTIVDDGTTIYTWNSKSRTVNETTVGKRAGQASKSLPMTGRNGQAIDPATMATDLINAVKADSTVSVDGTDMVANRPAYDLVLTPKPNQRTLLREVRIAVDADQHIPLQLTVLANNSDSPALRVGFSSLSLGQQDPSLFQFTAPAGSTVVKGDQKAEQDAPATPADKTNRPTIAGHGWETVVIAKLPASLSSGSADTGSSDNMPGSTSIGSGRSSSGGLMGIVRSLGTKVSGSWGTGYEISTGVGTAILTDDGRVAAGFVPVQVLEQDLSNAK